MYAENWKDEDSIDKRRLTGLWDRIRSVNAVSTIAYPVCSCYILMRSATGKSEVGETVVDLMLFPRASLFEILTAKMIQVLDPIVDNFWCSPISRYYLVVLLEGKLSLYDTLYILCQNQRHPVPHLRGCIPVVRFFTITDVQRKLLWGMQLVDRKLRL